MHHDDLNDLETIDFGLDGIDYQIDLSPEAAMKLREILAPYIEHARVSNG